MYIGIAEDDPDQAALLALWLQGGQHPSRVFDSAHAFIEGLKRERFDLLLIDWVLPDGTGADLLAWVRQNLGWELPVIVVTAREDEETVCTALRAGADDYIVKPPQPMALLARIEAVARRLRPTGLPVLRMGSYEIDVQRHRLALNGEAVALTQKEFDLAVYLFQNPGKLMSRDHLLNKVWGLNTDVDTRTVDTHISRLRKKLALDGRNGWRMAPVYGYGYRFDRVDSPDTTPQSAG
ncbi:two-component system response regulator [Vitreoscilla filiformis]|jgi:two-component system, OmpR family, response regulator RegX3|uniref:Two-component system response regulator n=1 Tax=Vitreoscilla filiformis TaxID=63 RepID=A0A221KHR2_VITFI|nr:response regulator transcription factor [Vitreoscilla filiformis]ASM78556.1 two-component system response regulator [Vitreoscilla filiformis]